MQSKERSISNSLYIGGRIVDDPAKRQIELLLVEDNPADVKLLQKCLHNVTVPYHLSVVSDGEAALAFLARHAPYTRAPSPALLLLDIHLPKKSGWDVLAWVRAQPSLRSLPVVMLTGILVVVSK
jgi:two-component system response regulator